MTSVITTLFSVFLLLVSSVGYAESLCAPIESKEGEPEELIIHEEDYSYSNALWAYSNVAQIIDAKKQGPSEKADYKSTANSEIVLKGYILRSNCLTDRKAKSCEEFCNFIKDHRYWYE